MLLLTAAESVRLDRATIDGGHVSGETLMERAGRGTAEAIVRHLGSPLAWRVLVLCGPGNNGGDGFVIARHLMSLGAGVGVAVIAARERITGDALAHLKRLEAAGVAPRFVDDAAALAPIATSGPWDLAIDALLGSGASGEPRGAIAAACEALVRLRAGGTRVVAVDVPSGVSADDGAAAAGAVRADLTVTFGHAKRGHFLFPGRDHRGALEVVDIGLLPARSAGIAGAELAQPHELRALLPVRDARAHKGTSGRALVIGGAPGMIGALAMCARAATRAGAGYVRAAAPASLHDALAAHLLEAMPVPSAESAQRTLAPVACEPLLAEAAQARAAAFGPGLSRTSEALALAHALLPRLTAPLVLDADGLFAFSPPAGELTALVRARSAPLVVTPHIGEMARLTGEDAATLERTRIEAAATHARRWGCVVVLKGAPTVVAAPDGRVSVNPTGNPGMATAGMGDVLTGTLTALLAQGLAPYDAARVAVFAHGLAGDLAARDVGAIGMVAGDVIERLPRALQLLRDGR